MHTPSTGLIALGANLPSHVGTPQQTLRHAMEDIETFVADVMGKSALYATPCFPASAGPDYVNAAMAVRWDGAAQELLGLLHDTEARFARNRDSRWAARPLDLDLIALGDEVAPDLATYQSWQRLNLEQQRTEAPAELILPHPRLQDRAFVLVPLAEVAPNWVHPVLGLSVEQMLARCSVQDIAEITRL